MPQVEEIKKQGQQLPAVIKQQLELTLRDHLIWMDDMLDNRDFNSAPAIITISPVDGSKWNPKKWFQKEYMIIPYCGYEGFVHRCEGVCKSFKMSKEWWEKVAPKLAIAFKVFSTGIQIACAGVPLGINAVLYEKMKNEVDFMKELSSHLELEGEVVSDISFESTEFIEEFDNKIIDLRQKDSEDLNRITRMQLAKLLEEIAPDNYKARQWGPLRRVRMGDNTYRWLCEEHARIIGK